MKDIISVERRLKTIKRHTRGEGLEAGFDSVLMASFGRYYGKPHKHHFVEKIGKHTDGMRTDYGTKYSSIEFMCVYCNTRVYAERLAV